VLRRPAKGHSPPLARSRSVGASRHRTSVHSFSTFCIQAQPFGRGFAHRRDGGPTSRRGISSNHRAWSPAVEPAPFHTLCLMLHSPTSFAALRIAATSVVAFGLAGCAGLLPARALHPDVLQSAEWRALVAASTDAYPATRTEVELAEECRRAISTLDITTPLEAKYDACIDSAVKLIDPANWYKSTSALATELQGRPVQTGNILADIGPNALLVTLPYFSMTIYESLVSELRQRETKLPVTRVILDLRGCLGGELEGVRAVASLFVSDGVALGTFAGRTPTEITAGVEPGRRRAIPSELAGRLRTSSLLVLVDAGTTSGAELFAGGLRTARRALLLGTRTAGRTEVFSVRQLDRRDRRAFLRGGSLLDSTGRSWQWTGLSVDVPLEPLATPTTRGNAVGVDPWIEVALRQKNWQSQQ
jgi:hypothetical protein